MTADAGFRLYATTVDGRGHQHSEGAYKFTTLALALAWVAREQLRRTILDVTIYDADGNVVGEAGKVKS